MTREEKIAKLKAFDATQSSNLSREEKIAKLKAFDSNQNLQAQTAPQEEPSQLESGIRGAAQGATLGFIDELTGMGEAGLDILRSPSKFTEAFDLYRKHRDESRAAYKAAQEANEFTYGASELGGGILTALVPGKLLGMGAKALGVGGAAKAATLAPAALEGAAISSKAAPLLESIVGASKVGLPADDIAAVTSLLQKYAPIAKKGFIQGAQYGGLYGAGQSEADVTQGNISGLVEDIGSSALTGGIIGGALEPAIAAARSTWSAGKNVPVLGETLESIEKGALEGKAYTTKKGVQEAASDFSQSGRNLGSALLTKPLQETDESIKKLIAQSEGKFVEPIDALSTLQMEADDLASTYVGREGKEAHESLKEFLEPKIIPAERGARETIMKDLEEKMVPLKARGIDATPNISKTKIGNKEYLVGSLRYKEPIIDETLSIPKNTDSAISKLEKSISGKEAAIEKASKNISNFERDIKALQDELNAVENKMLGSSPQDVKKATSKIQDRIDKKTNSMNSAIKLRDMYDLGLKKLKTDRSSILAEEKLPEVLRSEAGGYKDIFDKGKIVELPQQPFKDKYTMQEAIDLRRNLQKAENDAAKKQNFDLVKRIRDTKEKLGTQIDEISHGYKGVLDKYSSVFDAAEYLGIDKAVLRGNDEALIEIQKTLTDLVQKTTHTDMAGTEAMSKLQNFIDKISKSDLASDKVIGEAVADVKAKLSDYKAARDISKHQPLVGGLLRMPAYLGNLLGQGAYKARMWNASLANKLVEKGINIPGKKSGNVAASFGLFQVPAKTIIRNIINSNDETLVPIAEKLQSTDVLKQAQGSFQLQSSANGRAQLQKSEDDMSEDDRFELLQDMEDARSEKELQEYLDEE